MSGDWLAAAGLLMVLFGPGLFAVARSMTPARRAARHAEARRYGCRGYEALGPLPRRSNPAIPPRVGARVTIDRCRGEAVTDTITRPDPATPPSTATLHFPEVWLYDRGDRR